MTAVDRRPASALDLGMSCPRVSLGHEGAPVLSLGWAAVVAVLAFLPLLASSADTALLVNFFILLTMAVMWNLLAGNVGMVSIGQQAFVGIGAYGVIVLAMNGFNPIAAIPLSAVICAVIALPASLLVLRLSGWYFAIATWS